MFVDFAKGHGTRNDFVLIADPDDLLDLSEDQVAFLCDRRAGIGADGILRAVRASQVAEWDGDPDVWFMDYRNADGSIAEMCGNGLRVFLRYLAEEGLVDPGYASVATRSGLRSGRFLADGRIAVTMGPVTFGEPVTVTRGRGVLARPIGECRQPARGLRRGVRTVGRTRLDQATPVGAEVGVPARRERRVRGAPTRQGS